MLSLTGSLHLFFLNFGISDCENIWEFNRNYLSLDLRPGLSEVMKGSARLIVTFRVISTYGSSFRVWLWVGL